MAQQLYNITKNMRELQKLAEAEPEMLEAVKDTLDGMSLELKDKAEAIVKVMINMRPRQNGLKAEIERLQNLLRIEKNKEARINDYLRDNMDFAAIDKIECPLFTITRVIGRQMVVVDNSELVPDDYMNIPEIEAKVDKVKTLAALKAGEVIEGVHMERGKSSIRFR